MLNVTLQTVSMVLCIVGILQVCVVPRRIKSHYIHYIGFFGVLFLYSAGIMLTLLLSGKQGGTIHAVLRVSEFFEFLMGYLLTFHVANMMLARAKNKDNRREVKIIRTVLCVFLLFRRSCS